MNIIFAGTPEFAAHHLQALLHSEHRVIAVYTQPDRPAGRGKKLLASPVKQLASAHSIPVYQPLSLRDPQVQAELAALKADVMVVVAYGLILPQPVLDTPKLGCINVHASLLPRWRGAAPIQRAIEAGDRETGVAIMQMEAGLDTGPVLVESRCDISPRDTGGSLHDKLAELGQPALLQALQQLADGSAQPQIQAEQGAVYAEKISKQQAQIDWRAPAAELARKIRAFNPFPVCWTTFGDEDERLRIYQVEETVARGAPGEILSADDSGIVVACGNDHDHDHDHDHDNGALRLQTLQLPGKKTLPAAEILKGYRELFAPGSWLGK